MIKYPFTLEDFPFKNNKEFHDDLDTFNNSPISPLFPVIDNQIIHRRSLRDTIKILRDGQIYINRNSYYEETPGSENCFAFQNNYISLFDFYRLPFEIFTSHESWYTFLYDKKPVTILMQFDRDEINHEVISNSIRRSCPGKTGQYFPYVEVWHPEPLSVEGIERILVVFVKNRKILFEDITNHSRIENNDIRPELSDLLQRQDEYIRAFSERLLQISQIHKLNLEDPLITILTSL